MREERGNKNIETITHSLRTNQTERDGIKGSGGQISHLTDWEAESGHLGRHQFYKPLVKMNAGHFGKKWFSFCLSIAHQVHNCPVTCRQERQACKQMSIACFDFYCVNFFVVDRRCADLLRKPFSPLSSPTAFIFLLFIKSFNSAQLFYLKYLMAFKCQHLSPDSVTWPGDMN